MDKNLKIGQKISVKYPWLAMDQASGPLAELAFTALPGRPVDGGLLQEFLVGDICTIKGAEKLTPAAILDADTLDKNAKPAAGEKWKFTESGWLTNAGDPGVYDLRMAGDDSLIHVCAYVYSDAERKTQLWLASCTPIRVLVNGTGVHTNPNGSVGDPFTADADKVKDVSLSKGWNTIIMAIRGSGGWRSCALRIRDENGNVPTGLSYSAELPNEK
jgi:hypothetical protein